MQTQKLSLNFTPTIKINWAANAYGTEHQCCFNQATNEWIKCSSTICQMLVSCDSKKFSANGYTIDIWKWNRWIELNQGIRYIFLTSSPNYKSSCVTVTTRVTPALKILSPDWLIQPKQAFWLAENKMTVATAHALTWMVNTQTGRLGSQPTNIITKNFTSRKLRTMTFLWGSPQHQLQLRLKQGWI